MLNMSNNRIQSAFKPLAAVAGAILICSCGGGCSTTQPYETVTPGLELFEPFDVPLTVNEQGVAVVTVLTSMGPVELILDTGADQAILLRTDSEVINSLPRTGAQWKSSASGVLRRAAAYRIEAVSIGPLQFTGVEAVEEESSLPEFMPGDGVLGRGLIEGLTLDIDLPASRLGIYPAGVLPPDINDDGWIVAPLDSIHNGPVVNVRLDDSTTIRSLVLDTGAIALGDDGLYGLIELPDDIRPTRSADSDYPVFDARNVHVGDADIGPLSFYVKEYSQPPGTHGFLGNALFATHRVIIDPLGKRVFIRSAD